MAGAVLRPYGLQQDGGGRQPHLAQLLGDEEAVRFVANDQRAAGVRETPSSRAAVSCSMVRSPVRARSCLGRSSRDRGQRRVPAPPERMTGTSVMGAASYRY